MKRVTKAFVGCRNSWLVKVFGACAIYLLNSRDTSAKKIVSCRVLSSAISMFCILPIGFSNRMIFLGLADLLLQCSTRSILEKFKIGFAAGFRHAVFLLKELAYIDLKNANFERSEVWLELAYALDMGDACVSYNLGLLKLICGDKNKAKKLIMNAIEWDKYYAIPHQNLAARYTKKTWVATDLDLNMDPDLHLYDAYNYAGQVLFNLGLSTRGVTLFGLAMLLQEELAKKYPIPQEIYDSLNEYTNYDMKKPLRLLPYEWVTQIGHIGMIDALIKMQKLGMRPEANWVVLAPKSRVANMKFLECWVPYVTLVHDQKLIDMLLPYQRVCGEQFNCYVHSDGTVVDWSDAAAKAFIEWDRQGKEALITPPTEILELGRARLESLGMPNGSWFVGLHVRSSGFYSENFGFVQKHRNAKLSSYIPAIKSITRAGGWVLRVGDKSMPPLRRMPKVIDLARSNYWDRSLDLYIWSQARFFLGTTSGPTNAVIAFHTPVLLVNCVSNYAQSWNSNVLFILKPFWSKIKKRYLTMHEMFASDFRCKMFNVNELAKNGIYPEANSPEDILIGVREMLEYLNGNGLPAMQDASPLHDATYPLWLWGNAHPSKSFFSKHSSKLLQ